MSHQLNNQLTNEQSIENYIYFSDKIKKELGRSNKYLKITDIIVLDELYNSKLINYDFHKLKIKECINNDKKEELKDLYYSLVCSGFLMTIIFFMFLPTNKYYLFKICYYLYLVTICYVAYLFYTKSD